MNISIVKKLALKISIATATVYLAVSPAFAAEVIGKFPSLLGSDGARAVDTDIVWLGAERDKEANSEQVDADSDDGVVPKFNSCSASKVNFIVHLKKPGKTEGVAYLNLWADWNKDGEWLGADKCASEWAVQNYEINLSKQSEEIMIYAPAFVAGENVQDIWYRAAISYNEKLIRSDGGGEFSAGEVEDYGPVPTTLLSENATGRPRPPSKVRGLICYPRPLFTEHGGAITFTVGTMPGWEAPVSTGFGASNAGLNAGGTNITLPSGKITKQPKNPNQFGDPNNPFVFVSTSVHDVGLLETIPVVIEATYADNTTAEVTCTILVWHPEPGEKIVVPVPAPPTAVPDEDLDHNTIFTFIQSLGSKPTPPRPPFSPPMEPPSHNYFLTLYENGKDVIKSGAGKIKDLVTGGGKQGNVIAPVPAPITQTPPSGGFIGKPAHSEKASGLEELTGDKIAKGEVPVRDVRTLDVLSIPPLVRIIQPFWNPPMPSSGEPTTPTKEGTNVRPSYSTYCSPGQQTIRHGESATIEVTTNNPNFYNSALTPDGLIVRPGGFPPLIESPDEKITTAGSYPYTKYTYTSLLVHDADPRVDHVTIPIYVGFSNPGTNKISTTKVSCDIFVVHSGTAPLPGGFFEDVFYTPGSRIVGPTPTLNVFQRIWNKIIPPTVYEDEIFFPPLPPGAGDSGSDVISLVPPGVTLTPPSGDGLPPVPPPDNNDNIKGPGYVYTPPSGIRPVPVPGDQVQTPNVFQRVIAWFKPELAGDLGVGVGGGAQEGAKPADNDNIKGPSNNDNIQGPTYSEEGKGLPPIPPTAEEFPGKITPVPPSNNDNIQGPTYSEEGKGLPPLERFAEPFRVVLNATKEAILQSPQPYPEHYTNVSKLRNYILTPGGVSPDQKDEGEIEIGIDRKKVVIDLPIPPKVVSLPIPVRSVFSPLNFLSSRLIELSNQLNNLVSSVLPTPTYPRCIVKLLEDADQNNRFKYEAECTKYNNCSFEIRSLTKVGNLVSRKTFDLPTSGPLITTDIVPAAAAISNLQITCDGNSFTAIAHNPKAGGQNPGGNTPTQSPTITTSSLAGGTDDVAYSQTVRATGGSVPYTWSVYSGSLPAGLSLAASTGVISGTPTTAETANFTLQVSDAFSKTDTKAYSVTIAAGSTPLSLSAPSVAILAANSCVGDCSSINSAAYALGAGGTAPYTYSLSDLNACAQNNNLTINSGTGAYTTANVSTCAMGVTITVTDAVLNTASLVVPAVWQHIAL